MSKQFALPALLHLKQQVKVVYVKAKSVTGCWFSTFQKQ